MVKITVIFCLIFFLEGIKETHIILTHCQSQTQFTIFFISNLLNFEPMDEIL